MGIRFQVSLPLAEGTKESLLPQTLASQPQWDLRRLGKNFSFSLSILKPVVLRG